MSSPPSSQGELDSSVASGCTSTVKFKNKRLCKDQIQLLEESFEIRNKLEQKGKEQLAKDTGLHPHQIAIWFQNRRARSKGKQLEKEYNSLKESYDKLKLGHQNGLKENKKLRNEIEFLKTKMLEGENKKTVCDSVMNTITENVKQEGEITENVKQEGENSVFVDSSSVSSQHQQNNSEFNYFDDSEFGNMETLNEDQLNFWFWASMSGYE